MTFSDGTDLNSVATYDCVEGYEPASGDPLRFCRSDGAWSGEELVCDRGKKHKWNKQNFGLKAYL